MSPSLPTILKIISWRLHTLRKRPLRPVPGVTFERDVPVPMRDGVRLMANVYRPAAGGPCPVIISVSPYGKDELPETYELFHALGINVGDIRHSDYTAWEAPDPGFWVPQGYVVINADVRGMWKSEGCGTVLSQQDAQDYFDVIEWAATQPWSDGQVGLCGVSYLAASQWAVAALKPPHLRAIVPWEGASDFYREFAFQGGIPEVGFLPNWWRQRLVRSRNRRFPMAEDLLAVQKRHPLNDDTWAQKRPDLSSITVPALICASWSSHDLHSRGSLEAFKQIATKEKWLWTHGRREWEVFYSEEARAAQKQFFDHFLKGIDNGMRQVPPVRLEVRVTGSQQRVREEPAWPPAGLHLGRFYLEARSGKLVTSVPTEEVSGRVACASSGLFFDVVSDQDTELTGPMRLSVWVQAESANDLDLFVGIRKFDAQGREVHFIDSASTDGGIVAKGWLRVSHRELDAHRTTPLQPWHTHARAQKLAIGEIVLADVEILPSSTLFERGSTLRLQIAGRDVVLNRAGFHRATLNKGFFRLYTGGAHASSLIVPVVAARVSPDPGEYLAGRVQQA